MFFFSGRYGNHIVEPLCFRMAGCLGLKWFNPANLLMVYACLCLECCVFFLLTHPDTDLFNQRLIDALGLPKPENSGKIIIIVFFK